MIGDFTNFFDNLDHLYLSNNFVNYLGYANCLMTIMQSIRVLQNIANGI